MPELPEVETTLRGIEPYALGRTLTKVVVREPRLRWPIPVAALKRLVGLAIIKAERRAKYILLHTEQSIVLLHLGMSGSLRVVDSDTPADKHDHLDLVFDQQYIVRLNDPRRFGSCLVFQPPLEQQSLLASLGPEPLTDDFDGELLFKRSRGRKLAVKNYGQ